MWSQTTIPGRPRLLVVDSSQNSQGWEAEYCTRLSNVLSRRGVQLAGEGPLRVDRPPELAEALRDQDGFNCILLVNQGDGENLSAESKLSGYWKWLCEYDGLTPKLLAVCTLEDHDPVTTQAILSADESFAQFAIAPSSSLSPRAAGLFYMKFFTELDVHASDELTGRMVWFSRSKAQELLRRRRLEGDMGMRC